METDTKENQPLSPDGDAIITVDDMETTPRENQPLSPDDSLEARHRAATNKPNIPDDSLDANIPDDSLDAIITEDGRSKDNDNEAAPQNSKKNQNRVVKYIAQRKGALKNHKKMIEMKSRTNSLKVRCKAAKEKHSLKVPILVGVFCLGLMCFDQVSDIFTSKNICGIEYEPCSCRWSSNTDGRGICEPPGNIQDKTNPCFYMFGTKYLVEHYCNTYADDRRGDNKNPMNQSKCSNISTWEPESTLHPRFCYASIATIVVSHIINSTYLLISLWVFYPQVLGYIGLSEDSQFGGSIKIALVVLYCLQTLPYVWQVLHILIVIKALRSKKEMEEFDTWQLYSKKSKVIFILLEDAPQVLIQSMVIIRSAIAQHHSQISAGTGVITTTCLSIAVSSASIAVTLTMYKGMLQKDLTLTNKILVFISLFVSVGTRVLVCASYASSVFEEGHLKTWTLVLPVVIAVGLYVIEYFFCYGLRCLKNKIKEHTAMNEADTRKHTKRSKFAFDEDQIIKKLSILFEATNAESLSASFTYLIFAVSLHTVWVTEFFSKDFSKSNSALGVFLIIQYLALSSVIINMVIVQVNEWKKSKTEKKVYWRGKVSCFVYSVMFLLCSVGIHIMFHGTSDVFIFYKKLYFPDFQRRTLVLIVYPTVNQKEEEQLPYFFDLENIRIMVGIAALFVFANLVVIFISCITFRQNLTEKSSQEETYQHSINIELPELQKEDSTDTLEMIVKG